MVVDDVFGLEVAVDDLALVHVVQRPADLLHDRPSQLQGQPAFAFEEGVELAGGAEFLEEVEALGVGEVAVEFDDVGVVEEGLDFYLPHQLQQQLRVQPAPLDPLQRHQEPALPVTRHKHLPELALPQLAPQLEIAYRKPRTTGHLGSVGGARGHGFGIGRFGIKVAGPFGEGRRGFFEFFLARLSVVNEVASKFWVFVFRGSGEGVLVVRDEVFALARHAFEGGKRKFEGGGR